MRLLQRLPASVVRRVHRERHAAPYWITLVPEHQRLTDNDLQEFTRSLIGAALLSMFRYWKMRNYEKSGMLTNEICFNTNSAHTIVAIFLRIVEEEKWSLVTQQCKS